MSRLVYCEIKEKFDTYALYKVGSTIDDMSGEVIFYKESMIPNIIKQPNTNAVTETSVSRVRMKYKNSFDKGEFPEKMSVEIG